MVGLKTRMIMGFLYRLSTLDHDASFSRPNR
jgi:hypothetical protein